MFKIDVRGDGEIALMGRFDAAQVENARSVFDKIDRTCWVDFTDLDYISSGGLSVLLGTQKRLSPAGHQLRLKHMNRHIREVFKYAGFDTIFEIQ
jgi:anti-sigma B factor antagonist